MLTYAMATLVMEAWTLFVQVLIVVVFAYWSLDLSGRFWYILALLCLYAVVGSSLGVLLASATKDPRSAKELIPIIVLPQMLLCGFFVSVDDLPNWIVWVQWLMPETYAFRLFLAEEFSTCRDDSVEEEENVMNCALSIQNVLAEANLGTCSILDESALLGSQALPSTYFCTQYLESQNATGENNTQYWLTRVGMLVGIRLLAMFLLPKKAGGDQLMTMAQLRKHAKRFHL